MKSIIDTIKSFKERDGQYVLSSMVISKIMNFILSIFIVRLLAESVYGNISYALTVVQVILPLAGLGLHHSLLRFGALEDSLKGKNELFLLFLKFGTAFSIVLAAILFFLSDFITINLPDSGKYLRLFSPLILTFFFSEVIFSYFRVMKNNRMYSKGVIYKSILLFLLCGSATYWFSGKGYVIAYTLAPLIIALIFFIFFVKPSINTNTKIKSSLKLIPFVKYGFWVGIGSIASQLLILLDTIMVGNIIANSTELALYKVATIIPMNLLFIPLVIFRTDYVHIAQNYKVREFLITYYK